MKRRIKNSLNALVTRKKIGCTDVTMKDVDEFLAELLKKCIVLRDKKEEAERA